MSDLISHGGNRLLITGTNSGCGKTTVTCALLSALKMRGFTPTAFKCGPDFIDPMFHRSVLGVRAYNLDPFFLDSDGLRARLMSSMSSLSTGEDTHSKASISILEGAMGYYDGIAATDEASAYTVARETQTPALLVVSARGAGNSLGALLEGFIRHKSDSRIAGVIFNDAHEKRRADLEQIAARAGVHCYGNFPRNTRWELPGRHLGLLTAGEIESLQTTLAELGRQAEQSLDIDGLIELAGTADDWTQPMAQATGCRPSPTAVQTATARLPIAIARDEAFCFLYPENLELLEALGCTLLFFSPLQDEALPADAKGLYLCGGYPEIYVRPLSQNRSMTQSVRRAIADGLPTVAEGGGFMYLHETLDGLPLCGAINGAAFETKSLRRFGYITLTAERNNLLCRAGESIRAHEFHYWDSEDPGDGFTAQKAGRDLSYRCVHTTGRLYAGFPHLFLPSNPVFAQNLVKGMLQYAKRER